MMMNVSNSVAALLALLGPLERLDDAERLDDDKRLDDFERFNEYRRLQRLVGHKPSMNLTRAW